MIEHNSTILIDHGCPMNFVARLIKSQHHLIAFTVGLIVVKNEYKHKRHEHIKYTRT